MPDGMRVKGEDMAERRGRNGEQQPAFAKATAGRRPNTEAGEAKKRAEPRQGRVRFKRPFRGCMDEGGAPLTTGLRRVARVQPCLTARARGCGGTARLTTTANDEQGTLNVQRRTNGNPPSPRLRRVGGRGEILRPGKPGLGMTTWRLRAAMLAGARADRSTGKQAASRLRHGLRPCQGGSRHGTRRRRGCRAPTLWLS